MKRNIYFVVSLLSVALAAQTIAGLETIENPDRINAVCTIDTVTLYWEKQLTSETNYDLLRDGVTIKTGLKPDNKGKVHYIDSGLLPGKYYRYIIVTRGDDGHIYREFDITARTNTKPAPAPPGAKFIK